MTCLGALAAVVLLAGCGFLAEQRLHGRWETVETPKRSLELREDNTYRLRFSGRTLGVLSDLAGPEKGTWRVEDNVLVLTTTPDGEGDEPETKRWAIGAVKSDSMVLGDETWKKLP